MQKGLYLFIINLFLLSSTYAIGNSTCDTLGIQQLISQEENLTFKVLQTQLESFSILPEFKQDSLLNIVYCSDTEKKYIESTLKRFAYIGCVYFEYSRMNESKLLFEEILIHEQEVGDSLLLAIAHNYLGLIAEAQGYWLSAYFHFQKLSRFNTISNKSLYASAFINLGVIHASMGEYTKAENYYKKGLEICPASDEQVEYGWLIHRMGELSRLQDNLPKALLLLEDAYKFWQKIDYSRGACFTLLHIGLTHQLMGNEEEEIRFYNKSLALGKETNCNLCKMSTLLELGIFFVKKDNHKQAIAFLEESIDIAKNANLQYSDNKAYRILADIYFSKEEIPKAKAYYEQYQAFQNNKLDNFHQITAKSFEDVQRLFTKEKSYESLQQKEKYQAITLRFQKIIIAISILLIILFIGLTRLYYQYNKKSKKSYKELVQLNQKISQQSDDLKKAKNKIAFQKQDLEVQLVKKAMVLSQYGKTMESISVLLKTENGKSRINAITREINNVKDNHLWKELDIQISQANEAFSKKISQKYPHLTQNDLRLCALLKMNLNTKEIANLTFKTPESIKVARSRLRKKLDLTHTRTGFSTFLNQI